VKINIDKAIRTTEEGIESGDGLAVPLFEESIRLGLEALKQLRANRRSAWPNKADTLPGETEK